MVGGPHAAPGLLYSIKHSRTFPPFASSSTSTAPICVSSRFLFIDTDPVQQRLAKEEIVEYQFTTTHAQTQTIWSHIVIHCCSSKDHRHLDAQKARTMMDIFTPLFSQLNLLNMLFNVAVNSFGEIVSICLTPLLILIFSLSLCRCTVTELSVYMSLRILSLVLAMMSILLGYVLSRMPSRNPRKQHTVVCCIHGTSL